MVATAVPSHSMLRGPTDVTGLSGFNRNEKRLFPMTENLYDYDGQGKRGRKKIERMNMGHQYHWEENPPFVILCVIRSPQLTGSLNKESFSFRNVSELKSGSGNSSSDYVNYCAEDGGQRAQGQEEVTALPKLLLKITEPLQLCS